MGKLLSFSGRRAQAAAQETAQPAVQEYQPSGAVQPAAAHGRLAVHSVFKSFKKRPVVRGVSLSVARGEAVGLLGPNGAGKTTVFYMITGLIAPDSGTISFDGEDVTLLPMYRRARLGIGYLPQEPSIFRGLTGEENIRAVLELNMSGQYSLQTDGRLMGSISVRSAPLGVKPSTSRCRPHTQTMGALGLPESEVGRNVTCPPRSACAESSSSNTAVNVPPSPSSK